MEILSTIRLILLCVLNSQKSWSKLDIRRLWRSLVGGGAQVGRVFIRNWDGKPCITEDGTEGYVISFL